MKILGPDESHSVHKLKTTKIVVEEAASPDATGTFTFVKSSLKSEINVEEVASFSPLIEEFESDNESCRKMSRGISIVSVSEDEKISIEKETVETVDDAVEKLMQRIQKQRNVLDDIIGQESSKTEEKIVVKEEKVKQEVQPEGSHVSSLTNFYTFTITSKIRNISG
jgi:hypothetical protein